MKKTLNRKGNILYIVGVSENLDYRFEKNFLENRNYKVIILRKNRTRNVSSDSNFFEITDKKEFFEVIKGTLDANVTPVVAIDDSRISEEELIMLEGRLTRLSKTIKVFTDQEIIKDGDSIVV